MQQQKDARGSALDSNTIIITLMVLVGILAVGGGYLHHIASVQYIGMSVTFFSTIGGINHLNTKARVQRRIASGRRQTC